MVLFDILSSEPELDSAIAENLQQCRARRCQRVNTEVVFAKPPTEGQLGKQREEHQR